MRASSSGFDGRRAGGDDLAVAAHVLSWCSPVCGGPSVARPRPLPRQVPRLRELLLSYLDALTSLGQSVLAGSRSAWGCPQHLRGRVHRGPDRLVRIFSYPPSPPGFSGWGVGEHTDYGLLTLLGQDDSGGLQIAAPQGWTGSCSNRTSSLSATQPPPNRTRMRGRSGALNGSRSGSGLATEAGRLLRVRAVLAAGKKKPGSVSSRSRPFFRQPGPPP